MVLLDFLDRKFVVINVQISVKDGNHLQRQMIHGQKIPILRSNAEVNVYIFEAKYIPT